LTVRKPYGFTLVELMVVLTIIAGLLAFSIPRFNRSGMFISPQKKGAADLAGLITSLKHRAIRENRDLVLHMDISSGRMWVTDTTMDDPALADATATATAMPGNLRLLDIEFASQAGESGADTGQNLSEPVLRFSRHGYSDGAILHLVANNLPVSLKVAPFLMEIETVFDRISYDDCR
jgi:prepilin-type N-terminal cleavage/methylation domain-containing protein